MIRSTLALISALLLTGAAPPASPPSILIRGARVFDGTGAPAVREDLLVTGDRIAAIGPRLTKPRGARVIDATGLTLLPGLHDLHTHLRSPAFAAPEDLGKAYAAYLLAGVTSVNDYSVSGEMLQPIRAMTASGAVAAPRLELAIRLGVPGGHGTEFGWGNFFTMQVATPRAAHAAMARALPYKPDVIKVFADGWRYGRTPDLNSMNEPTLAAIVADAHAADIPVITHTVTLEGAKVAAAAGVDAVGHGVGDKPVDAALIDLMRAHGTGYISTLVVYEPQETRTFLPAEWADMRSAERADETARMAKPLAPIPASEAARWTILQDNLRTLKAAGIRISVGTDAGIGGVYHGSSTIREMRWLAKLGLTPAEVIVAATSSAAHILRQPAGTGTIAVGQRADLLLTGGRPDQRIKDVYDVRRVLVGGVEMPLKRLRALVDAPTPTPLPVTRMAGPIDSGTRADGRTDLDTLPVESTEPGVDHSHLDYVRPGAAPDRALFLVAHMGSTLRPFAQLIVPLTRGAVTPADASGFTGVAFTVRGAGRYRLLFDSYGIDQGSWFSAPFTADGSELRIPFAALKSADPVAVLDPARLRAVIVRLDGQPGGSEWLELKALRFYR